MNAPFLPSLSGPIHSPADAPLHPVIYPKLHSHVPTFPEVPWPSSTFAHSTLPVALIHQRIWQWAWPNGLLFWLPVLLQGFPHESTYRDRLHRPHIQCWVPPVDAEAAQRGEDRIHSFLPTNHELIIDFVNLPERLSNHPWMFQFLLIASQFDPFARKDRLVVWIPRIWLVTDEVVAEFTQNVGKLIH